MLYRIFLPKNLLSTDVPICMCQGGTEPLPSKRVACLLSTLVMLYCSIVWGAYEARVAMNAPMPCVHDVSTARSRLNWRLQVCSFDPLCIDRVKYS